MGNGGLADVFISYTSRDWGWASWLDFILREAGYTTKVQGYDSMVGVFLEPRLTPYPSGNRPWSGLSRI